MRSVNGEWVQCGEGVQKEEEWRTVVEMQNKIQKINKHIIKRQKILMNTQMHTCTQKHKACKFKIQT